jgi:Zn-dependent peptidase ImmA (M78 family)
MIVNDRVLEVKANAFRQAYGLNDYSSIDFEKLLSALEVLVVYRPLIGNFSGMALRTNTSKFMLVNTKYSIGRQRFTIGHELYHLCVQEGFSFEKSSAGRFDKKDREEYNADVFSSYLLMPEAGFLKQIPEVELARGGVVSLATIIKLEQYFGVSRAAILNRLHKIFGKDYSEYKENVKRSALEHGYSVELYEPTNDSRVIGNYGIKAKALFDMEKISESHYLTLMNDIGIDIDNLNGVDDVEEIY